jgi:tetratricopeptide (TPR) repeat protein/transcriptional regulator with XRE-family HTH domain
MQELFSYDFADLLRAFRRRSRLTQRAVADQLKVSRLTIHGWEATRNRPQNKAQVLALARVLRLNDREARQLLEASFTAPAPHWVVPYPRNPLFTGREDMLAQVHSELTAQQPVAVTSWALSGLGGIGKTQLALEYAYRHALDYNAVLWVDAETQESLVSSFTAIAKALEMPEWRGTNQQQLLDGVERWLQAHSEWLVIWDNVEETGLISRYLAIPHGAHLMTTRLATTGMLAQHLDLLPLPTEEALLFLLRRTKRLPAQATSRELAALAQRKPKAHAAAKALVELLDGLPLALDQAGAYIEAARCSIGTYLKQYQAQRGYLLAHRGRHQGHPESVLATFALAGQRLEQNATATALLRLCAFLAPDAIPEDLLTADEATVGEALASVMTDQFALDEACMALLDLSLIQREPEAETISVHRLVQAVQQEQLGEEEQRQWAERAVRLVSKAFPDSNEFANWGCCQQLLPHAQVCAGHIERWNFLFPEAASLLNEAGHYLRQRVRPREALPLLEQALKIRQQTLDPTHPDLALSLNNLGGGYWAMGQFRKALLLFQQALAIREQIFGPEHQDVARSLNNVAQVYQGLGQYEEAESHYLRALAIFEQTLGPNDWATATVLHNLAELYKGQAQYEEALPRYQQALAIRERTLESEHPDIAQSLAALATIYEVDRRYEEALALHQRALSIREQALGPDHLDVSYSLTGLATLYQHLGQDEEAILLFERALKIRQHSQGPEHPETVGILKDLADIYTKQGQYERAEPLYQRTLTIYEQQLGPDHPHMASALVGLAALRVQQNLLADARTLYRRALTIQERRLGGEHPDTRATRAQYKQLRQAPQRIIHKKIG